MSTNFLIIDPVAYCRLSLSKILRESGYFILAEANEGTHGLELIERTKPDIVITSLNLSKIKAKDLIRKIRKFDQSIKIIVCDIENDQDIIKGLKLLGVMGFINKPINRLDVLNIVRSVIQVPAPEPYKEFDNNESLVVKEHYDPSQKIGIKLYSEKKIQILYLKGNIAQQEIDDLIDTILELRIYDYNNIIISFEHVKSLEPIFYERYEIINETLKTSKKENLRIVANEHIKNELLKHGDTIKSKIYLSEFEAISSL